MGRACPAPTGHRSGEARIGWGRVMSAGGDPVLTEVVRRLVEAYRPERIYLFGSVARGEAGPDSDYDIMVIVPDDAPPERLRSRLAYRALRGTGAAACFMAGTVSHRRGESRPQTANTSSCGRRSTPWC